MNDPAHIAIHCVRLCFCGIKLNCANIILIYIKQVKLHIEYLLLVAVRGGGRSQYKSDLSNEIRNSYLFVRFVNFMQSKLFNRKHTHSPSPHHTHSYIIVPSENSNWFVLGIHTKKLIHKTI